MFFFDLMNINTIFHRLAVPLLATALTTAVSAQVVPGQSGILVGGAIDATARDVRVGGPLQPGQARPPLHVNASPATSVYYNPTQIRHAYGFDQLLATGINGTGQVIGIVDAYGNPDIQTDLNTFCNQFGLTSTTVKILGTTGRNTGWGLETALDVEWAHVVAPNATIILSVAKSSSYLDLLAAIDAAVKAGATVVSMSWGGSESSAETTYDSHFSSPSGVTFVASSGDSAEGTGVEWPASSPYVVGVGGTSVYLDANGNKTAPEVAWADSGGGLSTVELMPAYQTGWFQTGWPTTYRGVPDVSYLADPNTGVEVYDAQYGGWYVVGGTSVGAPQWAALIALANQARGSAGTLTSPNANIYSLANTTPATTPYTINPVNFFDVTTGSDGSDQDDLAGMGYDLVTGVGTPMANNLVPAMAPPDFSVSVTPGSQTVAPNGIATYTVTIDYFGGFTGTVNLSVTGEPGSPTWSSSSLSAPGTSTLTVPAGATADTYTLTITGTSASGSPSHSVTATLVVATPDFSISASPTSQSVSAGSSTTYNVTVTPSGGFTGSVALTASGLPTGVTASFSHSSVVISSGASGSSTMTVKTTSSTQAGGPYTLTITGTSPSLVNSTTVTLTVTSKRGR